MSATTIAKKRKSLDGASNTVKKAKISKSAHQPAPMKSALKKSNPSTKSRSNSSPAKKKITETVVEEEPTEANDTAELSPDQTAALLAGFSSDSDSASENEGEGEGEAGLALSSLPRIPSTGPLPQSTSDGDSDAPSVLYIGRIPHGFFERQMRAYFSQFGRILHLRLARNKDTGASQHYGFIAFASAEVAEIVRKTMDKYLLFGHLLQVRRVPREQVGENMFSGARRRRWPRNRIEGRRLGRGMEREVWGKRVRREEERRRRKAEVLAEMGYVFSMPGVRGVEEVPVRGKVDEAGVGGVEADEEVMALTNGEQVETEKAAKKRRAHGKTEVKKVVKKVKT